MPFVKLVKNKAYYKRYQTKYRRRREGKTDYYARKRLVTQAKNKYNSPKYRFVVRITCKDVICQFIYSKLTGDVVLSAAYAHELPRYGIELGLTNWAAAYATGLLAARRVLQKLGLDEKYEGNKEIDGTFYQVEELDDEEAPRPFKAYLDIGLRRTTTGSRIFACLKGAADGGVYIPHSEARFPGYDNQEKKLDAETLRKYIFGGHVSEYMEYLLEEDPEVYKRQFARYIEQEIGPEEVEDVYTAAHEKIREDPSPSPKKVITDAEKKEFKKFKATRLSYTERKAAVAQKKADFHARIAGDDE
ncbi:60S ribosomal protein L5 [Nowakowskiella sp. JEL0407]|nr:60S ribosomal protein L5 [Nowakowskiella sp. JEL0407]